MEKKGEEHKPAYFVEWKNPDDPKLTYYKYNKQYFEQDRVQKSWARLPDIYTEKYPEDFAQYDTKEVNTKK